MADSSHELEKMLRVGKGTVASHISRIRCGQIKKQRYFKIEINDEKEQE